MEDLIKELVLTYTLPAGTILDITGLQGEFQQEYKMMIKCIF